MSKQDDEKKLIEVMASQDAKMVELAESMNETKNLLKTTGLNEYSFSDLRELLKLESWYWKDALLILSGASPFGANVKWDGFYNTSNVLIKKPGVINAAFLNCLLPEYDVPADYTFGDDKTFFKNDKEVLEKSIKLRMLEIKLGKLYISWVSALERHNERNSPNFYVEWAQSKDFLVEWLDLAIDEGFYVPNKNTEVINVQVNNKPLSTIERDTLLIIIASLAKEAKVDIAKTSKAGEYIANLTQLIGATVGATTIETHLKKIPHALENRAK
jgi:hypothetical protein